MAEGERVLRRSLFAGQEICDGAGGAAKIKGNVQLKSHSPRDWRGPPRIGREPYARPIRDATHSPASLVPNAPPTSCVVRFCWTAASTAASILLASWLRPKWPSIMAAVRIAPKGLATFFPAIGGAEPCTGSNIDVFPGLILPLAAMPRPPCNPAARSVM